MNILKNLWEYVEGADDFNSPIKSKIRKYLNKDILQGIYTDDENKSYYLESTGQRPQYVERFIKKWCKDKGYTYLFDL